MLTTNKRERGLLVSVWDPRQSQSAREDAGREFEALTQTAGVVNAGHVSCEVKAPSPAFYVGKGKAEDLARQCLVLGVDVILIDRDLKPVQQRNLERAAGCKVIDRTGLILDIFARRAKSQEGQIQVELAQLMYLLPRLAGRGSLLSQLGGGIGTRGPGERKIEMDRRRIRYRMTFLQKAIERIHRHRTLQRQSRREVPLPLITVVGYTNAGKSTLLNQLSHSSVLTEDLLFATLDPTTRRVHLPRHGEVLVTDTVGFIQDLSVHLIAAFKATLEEVTSADLLIHVVDASHHAVRDHIATVNQVLKELQAEGIPSVMALNKVDRLLESDRKGLERLFPDAVMVSALTGDGREELMAEIERRLEDRRHWISVRIPYSETRIQALLHQFGMVEREVYRPQGVEIDAWVDEKFASRLLPYRLVAKKS